MSDSTPRAAYPACPYAPDVPAMLRRVAEFADRVNKGKFNATADVTLTANAATTVLHDPRLSYYTAVLFMPLTANAAAEQGAGTMYVLQANMLKGQLTITHANNAQADRSFRALIIG